MRKLWRLLVEAVRHAVWGSESIPMDDDYVRDLRNGGLL